MHVSFWKDLILTRVLGLPQSEIDQRPDKKSRRGFPGAPTALAGVRTNNRPLPASFRRQGRAVPHGAEGRGVPGGRRRGGSAGFVGRGCSMACPALAADGPRSELLDLLLYFVIRPWLCWVFTALGSLGDGPGAARSVRRAGFSPWWRLFRGARGQALGLRELRYTGSAALRRVGSPRTRDRTCVPCIGGRTLYHRASGKPPASCFCFWLLRSGSGDFSVSLPRDLP